MSSWTRVAIGITVVCGRCGLAIPPGAPRYLVTIAGVARALSRCEACEGPAPRGLPPLAPPPPVPVAGARVVRFDWRARASGERDPGEEG